MRATLFLLAIAALPPGFSLLRAGLDGSPLVFVAGVALTWIGALLLGGSTVCREGPEVLEWQPDPSSHTTEEPA